VLTNFQYIIMYTVFLAAMHDSGTVLMVVKAQKVTLVWQIFTVVKKYKKYVAHGLSRRHDGCHHHESDLLWARSPIR